MSDRPADHDDPPYRPMRRETTAADELLAHSVYDEPTFNRELAPEAAAHPLGYAELLAGKREATSTGESWTLVLLMAAAAGPFAVIGALLSTGGVGFIGVLAAIIAAPLVEEMMKIALPMWATECRPWWFRSRAQILVCGFAGGLAFAAIENVLYLNVYIPNPGPGIIAWRWTVCVALHVGCSTIASLGLAKVWSTTMRTGERPRISRAAPWIVLAMLLHGAYNAFATVLSLTGYAF